jgi:hypothetical protein
MAVRSGVIEQKKSAGSFFSLVLKENAQFIKEQTAYLCAGKNGAMQEQLRKLFLMNRAACLQSLRLLFIFLIR